MDKVRRIVLLQKARDEQLRAMAPREPRSLSAQSVHCLEEAVARDQSAARLGPVSQAAQAGENVYSLGCSPCMREHARRLTAGSRPLVSSTTRSSPLRGLWRQRRQVHWLTMH